MGSALRRALNPRRGGRLPATPFTSPAVPQKTPGKNVQRISAPLMRQPHKEIPVRSCDTFPARKVVLFLLLLVFCAYAHAVASGQTGRAPAPGQPREQQSTVIFPETRQPAPAARPSETACGGFIEQAPQAAAGQIVGAEEERERRVFGQGDLVFIDAGAQGGMRAGQEFSIVRPRGSFRTKFTRKAGSLGVYTQEVGRLRVERVRDRVSVARVTVACGAVLFGDLL